MKTQAAETRASDEPGFVSSFDPVIHGVARGLAALFPPIENARRPVREDEAGSGSGAEDERGDE